METIKLSDLLGQEIAEISFYYTPENEYGLQSFHTYIRLADNRIIEIPFLDDEEYLQLTPENISYMQERFDTGNSIEEEYRPLYAGQQSQIFFSVITIMNLMKPCISDYPMEIT